jgi:hypothetical protein
LLVLNHGYYIKGSTLCVCVWDDAAGGMGNLKRIVGKLKVQVWRRHVIFSNDVLRTTEFIQNSGHYTLVSKYLSAGEFYIFETNSYVRFQVITAANTKMRAFWDIAPYSLVIALMMDAVRTSVTSVYFNETTRRCISEGCHLNMFAICNSDWWPVTFALSGFTYSSVSNKSSV